jgi:hypothetical protein
VSDLPESAREPECTCTLFEREGQFDPKCHYHGENGTMVVKVPRSVWDRTYRPPVSPAVEEEPGGISEEVIHAAYDAADATLETSAQGRWLRPAIEAALNAAWPFLKSSPAVEEPDAEEAMDYTPMASLEEVARLRAETLRQGQRITAQDALLVASEEDAGRLRAEVERVLADDEAMRRAVRAHTRSPVGGRTALARAIRAAFDVPYGHTNVAGSPSGEETPE